MLRQTVSALRTPAVEQLLRSSSCVTATTLSRSYHKNVSCTDPLVDPGSRQQLQWKTCWQGAWLCAGDPAPGATPMHVLPAQTSCVPPVLSWLWWRLCFMSASVSGG